MSVKTPEPPEFNDVPDELVEQEEDMVYLSGPIRKAEEDGREWRNGVIEEYGDRLNFNNPLDMYDPGTHNILCDPKYFDEDSEKTQVLPSEYVTEDKLNILNSEYLLVGLPDIVARGTLMECMYAYGHGIPIFIWTIDEQKESGWIFEHAAYIGSNLDVVMKRLMNYES
jgi:hypothetical protein